MKRRYNNTHAHKAVRLLLTAVFAVTCFGITYGVLEASTNHVTNSYRYFNNQGYVLTQQGAAAQAIPYLEQAVALNPSHMVARNNLANAYRAEKNYDQAKAEWHELSTLHPDSLEALVGLGNVAADEKNFNEAIRYYEQAIQLDANRPVIFFNLGNAYYNKHDIKHAIAAYEKSLVGNPNFAGTHYNLSRAYAQADDYVNALKHLESATKLDPKINTNSDLMAKLMKSE